MDAHIPANKQHVNKQAPKVLRDVMLTSSVIGLYAGGGEVDKERGGAFAVAVPMPS